MTTLVTNGAMLLSSNFVSTNSEGRVFAQITPDNTLGQESSVVEPNAQFPVDVVEGGATRGANLFHSFSEFNIEEGRGAYFYSPSTDIQNILARVTGGNPSQILGTIGTFGNSYPNLFLINPKGIIFGANASLDMGNSGLEIGGTGGSFVATTANAVLLGNQGAFSASNPAASNLLSVNPSALFFNTSQAEIINRSTATNSVLGFSIDGLQVPNGRSLLLVGGEVNLDGGQIVALGGQVELGGVRTGTVGLTIDGNNLKLDYPAQVQRADVSLTNQAVVFTSAGFGTAGKSGNINISANSLALDNAILDTVSRGQGDAGNVAIKASDSISLVGSRIRTYVDKGAEGNAGSIDIQSRSLSLANNSFLSTGTSGQGDGGNVTLRASDSISLVDSAIFTDVDEGAKGNAGSIDIQSRSLSLANNSFLSTSTSGQGDGGNLSLNASDSVSLVGGSAIFTNVFEGAEGNAGNVDIQSRSLFFDSARLSTNTSGLGNAGSISLQSSDSVSLAKNSSISSLIFPGGEGEGGDINVQTRSLSLNNNSALFTDTTGQGDAGNVVIQASDSISLVDSGNISSGNGGNIFNELFGNEDGGVGNAGNVSIFTGSLSLSNQSYINTDTRGIGDAGDIFIRANGSVSLTGDSGISSGVFSATVLGIEFSAIGNGGDITIEAESLSLGTGSSLSTSTIGSGDSGDLSVRVNGSVSLTGDSAISTLVSSPEFAGTTGTEAVGNAGIIEIEAQSLTLDSASLTTATSVQGNAGAIFVQANNVSLTNDSLISSAVAQGGIGSAGDIDIQTRSLSLTGGSQIRATIERLRDNLPGGQGEGGNLKINATENVDIAGVSADGFSSGLSTSTNTGASGQAGDITVSTSSFRIANGAFISALTRNASDAGNITINAESFEATNGGQVLTTASNSGSAGNITLNITNQITLSGSDSTFADRFAQFGGDVVVNQGAASGLFASTTPNSTGAGGSIFIDPIEFTISDGAGVSVDSLGKGDAGNLQVQAGSIILDRGGSLSATTASGEGGNITIQAQDLLLLRRNSNITTAAGGSGNGGNIGIDTIFIVAPALEDSNIIADAVQGQGGNINISADGIFGIQSRPQQTPLSDITASSELGIDGTVDLNTPDVDPSQGLVTLPVETVDAANQIATGCTNSNNSVANNKFTVTGRGGLPPNPGDALGGDAVLTNWATLQETEGENISRRATTTSTHKNLPTQQIVEAQGWIVDANGKVFLTAQAPNVTPNNKSTATSCNGS